MNEPSSQPSGLIELWGDTVDSRHVSFATLIGVGLAVPTYLGARTLFTAWVSNASLAKSYSLLAGLAACLVAAVICARLFAPKRVVGEHVATPQEREAALLAVEAEVGPLGHPADLPAAVQEELRDLGLFDTLAERATQRGGAA